MTSHDRRAPGAPRISFDGLVEVGGALGPSFEAHAVNVSEEGMQLRTAYLPELGQQITCRFETAPNEGVIGAGEVIWSRAAEQGGEFGIRFTDIDAESVEALKRVCGLCPNAAQAQPGAKVRLYIDGLASPMRAKIRDATASAITVGSDLGFLQVGKLLDLEDAQSGTKRAASIHRVEVAVDPSSRVPQLVVTLRYAGMPPEKAQPEENDAQVDAGRADPPSDGHRMDDLAALDEASARMKGAFSRHAARIGPAFEQWARRAKMTIMLLAKRRRREDAGVPRRTTAPPPGGGLHSSGRRVVRGETSAPVDAASVGSRRGPSDEKEGPRARRWATAKGRALGAVAVLLVAVVGAIGIKRAHHDGTLAGSPAGGADTTVTSTAANSSVPAPTVPQVAQPLAQEVSPVTTTPSPPGAGTSSAKTIPQLAIAEDTAGTHNADHKRHLRPAPFGNGPVHHGNVLRLKMDGPIESIEGAQQPTGFALKVPGRRSLEAAAPLAARDSRIATIKVTNEPAGAELIVAFKDGVPNYQVSAKGDVLVIALSPAGPLEATVAKRDDQGAHSPKHAARGRDATPER